jgi:hypothetical protein
MRLATGIAEKGGTLGNIKEIRQHRLIGVLVRNLNSFRIVVVISKDLMKNFGRL